MYELICFFEAVFSVYNLVLISVVFETVYDYYHVNYHQSHPHGNQKVPPRIKFVSLDLKSEVDFEVGNHYYIKPLFMKYTQ